nr:hypothetical protein [Tanacetum cinerariifolium]
MELDEHVPVHVPEPKHPEYHAPSDDDIQEHEPEDEDTGVPSEDFDETKPFEENKNAALTDAFAAGSYSFPLPLTSPAYDQAPLGHRAAMIRWRDDIIKEDMLPRRRFASNTPPPGFETRQGLNRSPGHDAWTIARDPDRADDVGYAQVHRQESKYLYTQLHDAQTDRKDIRLEIYIVRGQRTAYETKLQEVHQAYLSSEDQNRGLLACLETLETHVSRMEWQPQSTEDLEVTQMMRIHALEPRARIDMVEDANSSC